MSDSRVDDYQDSLDIAIIGMTCRFPGAPNIEVFWQNLCEGVESIAHFTDQELEKRGVEPAALSHPNFVKAGALLEDIDLFDATFFGYAPKEAALIDPQQRIFLECAWEALEQAGYTSETYNGMIGVYAGMSMSTYLLFNILSNPASHDAEDIFQIMIGTDKDFLSTRTSYKLNLKGPSIDIQTGCSTSLVATHFACQSLLTYQCDMALAGGISIQVPQRTGYYYQVDGIASPDGHCRAFDANARGTIFGSGVGLLVLKRMADAIADGDTIYALIKGSAINNDGANKIGFTAPSVEGQAEVIARAQSIAGVAPETIGYVEAHGTGTALGDPIEVDALTRAFRAGTQAKNFCAIGSVKSNIGHLDAAAGIAGLIKTVLAVSRGLLPPTLHFEQPNPQIDFANSPFYVNTKLQEWRTSGGLRRAGVSSFGIGGTNTHVVVEQAPALAPASSSRPWSLLVLSAKTESALDLATTNLATYLRQHPQSCLADLAYTLQVGRSRFTHRRAIVCRDREDALAVLETPHRQRIMSSAQESADRTIVFMFPGGGAQYVAMGHDLYQTEAVFREQIDICAAILQPLLGFDIRAFLYPAPEQTEEASGRMRQPSVALPALFAVEYALAQLWVAWGIRPQAMIGHSLGEYAAACLAGVFSLEDALALVVVRGQLFERLPGGGMLSIPLPEHEIRSLIGARLSVAAINGPSHCAVSGPADAIAELVQLLTEQDVEFRQIQIDVAAHSAIVTPILDDFGRFLATRHLRSPQIPFISNVTGTWITSEEASDPAYWVRHLQQTVRFADGIGELLADPAYILLEVGPGQTLTSLARLQSSSTEATIIPSMRHSYERLPDSACLLAALGKLWMAGVTIDWSSLYAYERRRRVPLPTYPFERQRYWIDPQKHPQAARPPSGAKKARIADWFYVPSWKRAPLLRATQRTTDAQIAASNSVLLCMDSSGLGDELAAQLKQAGRHVVCVVAGEQFAGDDDIYTLNPGNSADYRRLIHSLQDGGISLNTVIHLWMVTPSDQAPPSEDRFAEQQHCGFFSLIYLTQALAERQKTDPLHLAIISNHLHQVESADRMYPEKATVLGACKVIPQEYDSITCRSIDIVVPTAAHARARLAAHILAELDESPMDHSTIAYRGEHRWVQIFEPIRLERHGPAPSSLRTGGVYLITGGLGQIGLLLAEYLAQTVQAKLILLGRSAFPERADWDRWLSAHDDQDQISQAIHALRRLETHGGEVLLVRADVADEAEVRSAVEQAVQRFGALHGVVHAAGVAGEKTISFISETSLDTCAAQFHAKVYGTYTLARVLKEYAIDFCVLFSSNTSVLGGLGSIAYSAANLFMDSFAAAHNLGGDSSHWVSANWDGWLSHQVSTLSGSFQTSIDKFAMTPQEGLEAFSRVISTPVAGQIIVSTGDLMERLAIWIYQHGAGTLLEAQGDRPAVPNHPRPDLKTMYQAPQNQLEQLIAAIWQELLGITQIGVEDNFFDLGGNSMVGLKVISRLKKALGIDIPVVTLFEGPTIRSLAALLSSTNVPQTVYEASSTRGEQRRERRQRSLAQ